MSCSRVRCRDTHDMPYASDDGGVDDNQALGGTITKVYSHRNHERVLTRYS